MRVADFARRKSDGEKWAMLTAYDYATARVFAQAGIECLLVGDSAANVVYGYDTTSQVSVDEMAFLGAAVVRGAGNALVIMDLPFGSYEASDEQCVRTATDLVGQTIELEFSVRDTGIGIAPEDQKRVFERFYRVDKARSRSTGGTGLGLAIVKHVVANHGGTITLWSRPGTGSTFTIELPIFDPEHTGSTEREE